MEDAGLLLIRIMIGVVFLFYGSQKLFGWFGGYGIKGTGQWFESIGVKPGNVAAALSGLGELGKRNSIYFRCVPPAWSCYHHDHYVRCYRKSPWSERICEWRRRF